MQNWNRCDNLNNKMDQIKQESDTITGEFQDFREYKESLKGQIKGFVKDFEMLKTNKMDK